MFSVQSISTSIYAHFQDVIFHIDISVSPDSVNFINNHRFIFLYRMFFFYYFTNQTRNSFHKRPSKSYFYSVTVFKPRYFFIGSKSLSPCNNVKSFSIQKVAIKTSIVFLMVTPFLRKTLKLSALFSASSLLQIEKHG